VLAGSVEKANAADLAYAWLLDLLLTDGAIAMLFPEFQSLDTAVHPIPNLRAVNIVVNGALGRGVNENMSLDPQGKGLGEFLRARVVEIPEPLLAT